MNQSDELVLHLIWTEWEDMPCLVSPATLLAAQRATAPDAPHPPMYVKDLRRPGQLEELEELLDGHFGATVEQYVAAIEAAAGRPSKGGDLAARLAALDDFEFAGDDVTTDDYDGLPADDHILDPDDGVQWGEPEVRYWDVISKATENDLPWDVDASYTADSYATGSPGSSGAHIGSFVDPDRLEELIAEVEALGYVVHRRDRDIVNRESSGLGL